MIQFETSKDKIAIVVVGYNKLRGLSRLLQSLNNSEYNEEVPLVISIDASGNEQVYKCAREFEWRHGEKYVNIEASRLGLKKHIFQCASLVKYFKAVVILEDDILVSPFYFHYIKEALNNYGEDSNVSGIALYNEEINGYLTLPFQPVHNGNDVYAWQTVCSWGQVWNERMWNDFSMWLERWNGDLSDIDIPDRIKGWKRAWSKYYYAYMISNDKYFIYPYQALSTNFNDEGGEHGGGDKSVVQVSLLQGRKEYQMDKFERLIRYDVYYHNMDIYRWLGLEQDETTIDFYGMNNKYKRYILSPFKLPYKKIKGYSLSMRPWELNIKYGVEGKDIFLYDRGESDIIKAPYRVYQIEVAKYFLRGFKGSLLIRYIPRSYMHRIKMKMKRFF